MFLTTQEQKLVGLKVSSLSINSDKTLLVLHTDGGDVNLYATGDCCSKTWFENISGVNNLVGHTIFKVVNNEFPELTKRDNDDYDVIQFYSFSLKTEKGTFEIEYRNSSNGYYGGSIELEDEHGYKPYGYHSDDNLKELTEDF